MPLAPIKRKSKQDVMHRCVPIAVAFALLALPVQAATASLNEQYNACTRTATTDPDGTYKRARAWYGKDKSLAAQHCMALALYNLKDYANAARTLEDILTNLKPAESALWLNMKSQAAKAQAAANNSNAAINHLNDGLYWAADREMDDTLVPLLLQRAALYDKQGKELLAVQDYDHAMSIRPSAQTRLARAQLFLKMGKTTQAIEDIDVVLKAEPTNKNALSMRALASR